MSSAATRYVTVQPGIRSWHCFSAGGHYDAARVSFGPIVGIDEHLVEPGAGFDWHAHRGVHLLSWVLDGTLKHEDADGEVRLVAPGALLVQSSGAALRHRETNPSTDRPVRFLQITLLAEAAPAVTLRALPARVAGVDVTRHRDGFSNRPGRSALVFVVSGGLTNGAIDVPAPGDWWQLDGDVLVDLAGDADLLVLEFD